ncbi:MAG: hypothetical protein Q8L23_03725 [Caulobacter sp.]|nr:hypothetical protein [Caulobacter sp.]
MASDAPPPIDEATNASATSAPVSTDAASPDRQDEGDPHGRAARVLDGYLVRRLLKIADEEAGLLEFEDNPRAYEAIENRLTVFLAESVQDTKVPEYEIWATAWQGWASRREDIASEARRVSARRSHTLQVFFFCAIVVSSAVAVGIGAPNVDAGWVGQGFPIAAVLSAAIFILAPIWRSATASICLWGTRSGIPNWVLRDGKISGGPKLNIFHRAVRWYTREPAVKFVTPSFLVAIAGLIAAIVSMDKDFDSQTIGAARALDWLWDGRGELGISTVLGLSAFIIEHVLGNLNITKDSLFRSAEKAKDSAEKIAETQRDLNGLLQRTVDTTSRLNSAAKSFTNFGGLLEVSGQIQKLSAQAWRAFQAKQSRLSVALGIAQHVLSGRLDSLFERFDELFSTMATLVNTRVTHDGSTTAQISKIYQANLLVTAFEAAIESQDKLFKMAAQNGQHFEIAAPFEALALTVSKFVDAVSDIPDDVKSGQNKISFYTVFPLRPAEFLTRAQWAGDPLQEDAIPLDAKSKDWIDFLNQMRRAKQNKEPVIVRHFLCVGEKLFRSIVMEYEKHVYELRSTERMADVPVANKEHHIFPVKWNPLALESNRFTLLESWVGEELENFRVKRVTGGAYQWKTREAKSLDDENTSAWIADFKPMELGAIPLGSALYDYHAESCPDNHGGCVRVIRVDIKDWNGAGPDEKSPLNCLLENEDSEWVLIDYFAGRVHEPEAEAGQRDRWVFAIRSLFNPEMGVVRMRLCLPDQPDWNTKTVPRLNRLFGLDGQPRDHIGVVDRATGRVSWPS